MVQCDQQTKCTHPMTTKFPIDQFYAPLSGTTVVEMPTALNKVGYHSRLEPAFQNFEEPK